MSGRTGGRLRIALLQHGYGLEPGPERHARELALALGAAGHEVEVLAAGPRAARSVEGGVTVVRRRALPDAPLRLRKIGERPGRLPGTWLALRAGGYDVAQAFTPQDAAVAVLWSRRAGRPAVFCCCEPLSRATIANRRLRLALLRRAVERSDAIIAPAPEVAASVRRWMAVEPRVIPRGSAEGHLAVYEELIRATQSRR